MKNLLPLILLFIVAACSSDDSAPGAPATPIPTANFSASTTDIEVGQSVSFTNSSQNATSYSWSFAGGSPGSSTQENPSITYNTAGMFAVTLTATNSEGSDVETKTNYINVVEPGEAPTADFMASETTILEGESVSFTDASSNNPTSWSWTFNGGNPSTSSSQNPSVTYNTAGTYTVMLTASNANGSDAETKLGYITVEAPVNPPTADFSASATTIQRTSSVTFTDESTNNPTSWNWSFEGGTPASSTAQNPMVTYNTAGTFDVTLTATNADGSDSETKLGYITVNALSATYTVTFRGNWSAANHPTDFPAPSDHFSQAVGMVHNNSVTLFDTGTLATTGIEDMAELGSNGNLQSEVNAVVNAGNALSYINGPGLGTGISEGTFSITVTEDYPLVSLVSMIAPSPDWFVAVRNVELYSSGGGFVDNLTLPAGSYDSGTDSGATFTSGNADTNPAENIHLITTAPLGNGTTVDPHVAEFVFVRN